jgi:hypothetical protein
MVAVARVAVVRAVEKVAAVRVVVWARAVGGAARVAVRVAVKVAGTAVVETAGT